MFVNALFKKFRKIPDPFEKNTSNDALNTAPFPGSLSMITPPLISSAESNGDIYYSTFLRFVKRLSEDFSKILRSGLPTTSLHPASTESNFEENTGLLQNRYLIIYTQKSTLSSKIPNKSQKNMVHATNGAGRQDNSHITFISQMGSHYHLKTDYGAFSISQK